MSTEELIAKNPLIRKAAEESARLVKEKEEKKRAKLTPEQLEFERRLKESNEELRQLGWFKALVLDSNYMPVGVVPWQRAVLWDYFEKVQPLEYYDQYIRSSRKHQLPAVVRLKNYVDKIYQTGSIRVNKRNVLIRDRFTCQYCESRSGLTIDHVIPIARGGRDAWDNVVCCCERCNVRKSFRTPAEMGWTLPKKPRAPNPQEALIYCSVINTIRQPPVQWRQYLFPLAQYFLQLEGLDSSEMARHMKG